jgi:hypothetical protein
MYANLDYSPNPSATDMTIVLEEADLKEGTQSQYDRFLRVWVTDRELYAPKLKRLTIALVDPDQGTSQGTNETTVGITRFVQCFQATRKGAETILRIESK